MQTENQTSQNEDIVFDDALDATGQKTTVETSNETDGAPVNAESSESHAETDEVPSSAETTDDTAARSEDAAAEGHEDDTLPPDEESTVTFSSFGFCPEIMQALNEAGFREPTPIQIKAIPYVMEGRDVIGQALTGTGKTAAFGLPTMQKIMNEPGLNLLVLVPTRELAAQVSNEL